MAPRSNDPAASQASEASFQKKSETKRIDELMKDLE
jgi:hypothetical protein